MPNLSPNVLERGDTLLRMVIAEEPLFGLNLPVLYSWSEQVPTLVNFSREHASAPPDACVLHIMDAKALPASSSQIQTEPLMNP